MLAMQVFEAAEKTPSNVLASGVFNGRRVGLEIAVKNSSRPDGKSRWRRGGVRLHGSVLPLTIPLPKSRRASCSEGTEAHPAIAFRPRSSTSTMLPMRAPSAARKSPRRSRGRSNHEQTASDVGPNPGTRRTFSLSLRASAGLRAPLLRRERFQSLRSCADSLLGTSNNSGSFVEFAGATLRRPFLLLMWRSCASFYGSGALLSALWTHYSFRLRRGAPASQVGGCCRRGFADRSWPSPA